jgi:ribosome biogenesis GTPase
MHQATGREDYPAVGDWVALTPPSADYKAQIQAILPRVSKFARKAAGAVIEEQIVAANIDLVFICMGLDADYNLRRLERYLAAAWESGALPVVVLTKADLCEAELDERLRDAEAVAIGAEVLPISSINGEGLGTVKGMLTTGKTGALIGSSGVGKSTLINHLLGFERQTIGEVRTGDGRGRHTTTHRELILLEGGGLLVDTPGMRELHLMDLAGSGVEGAFEDIEQLAQNCRFRDCHHRKEPGCAVKEALRVGNLDARRLESYEKLQREQAMIERKAARRQAMLEKRSFHASGSGTTDRNGRNDRVRDRAHDYES